MIALFPTPVTTSRPLEERISSTHFVNDSSMKSTSLDTEAASVYKVLTANCLILSDFFTLIVWKKLAPIKLEFTQNYLILEHKAHAFFLYSHKIT
jgi:hypothetical protein